MAECQERVSAFIMAHTKPRPAPKKKPNIKAFCMGIDADVFDNSKLADSPHALTDGTFGGPLVLAYYVENYDVALPAEFEEHMRANGWKVPRS